jgi:flagellar L-ring protein precursor FlgH
MVRPVSVSHLPSASAIELGPVNKMNMWPMPGLAGVPAFPQIMPGFGGLGRFAPLTGFGDVLPMAQPIGWGMMNTGLMDAVIPAGIPPLAGVPMLAASPIMTLPIPMQSTSIMAQAMGVWSEVIPGDSALSAVSMFAVTPAEPRLFHTHDLVQIIVREASVAASIQGLETEKEFGLAGGVENFPGVNGLDPLYYTEFDIVAEKEFEGEGEYIREDELVTRLTAEVIEIRPNGNLVLEARTRIRTDGEEWFTELTGVCRADDVTAANTILSNQIFDLQVNKQHKGDVRDAASKGILAQALDMVFAF